MNNKIQVLKYFIFDYLAAILAWTFFYLFRKIYIEQYLLKYDIETIFDLKYYIGLVVIPIFWISIYYITGEYKNVYRKSRLQELWSTFILTIVGVLVIFFTLILDDVIVSYKSYYLLFGTLLLSHFILTYIPRLAITTRTINRLRKNEISFNTIFIGGNEKALEIYKGLNSQPKSAGNKFFGFVSVHENNNYALSEHLPLLGSINDIKDIIEEYDINEVVIAIELSERKEIGNIINKTIDTQAIIKAIPDTYDIITGTVQLSSIYSPPLVEIKHELMPAWQENTKRLLDVFFSIIAVVLSLPLLLFLVVGVKLSSKGPILYSHERIGKYGKPFKIYKFRSMQVNAEEGGPQLSSKNDNRITPFGRFMRKTRLDEIPQFFNVLIGDMSIVGPRPERQFYIDQIVKQAPYYMHLLKVRPGITSWGQVKFGYAENVEEMIKRLQFDLIYIENMSGSFDLMI
jgi:exopolysaccharide biosynthesis polyprenyl glycosylphosphotransferase